MSRLFLLLFLLPTFVGCAGGAGSGTVEWSNPEVDIVWPDPPETSRIRYLRNVTAMAVPGAGDEKRGPWFEWLTGENDRQMPLLTPYAVVADGEGRIWVADTQGKSVVFFDLSRGQIKRYGVFDGISLQSPIGLALDAVRQRLYVSDSRLNRILVSDLSGGLITIFGHENLQRPAGLAIDAQGNLYVADVDLGEVLKFSPEQKLLGRFGSHLNPDGKFNRPANLAVGPDGALYVVDSLNFRVEIVSASGESLGSIGQLGDIPGSFARPRGVALDSEGHVYVADAAFGNIQIFNREGQLLLFFGESGKGAGQFSLPAGLFFDSADRLYVVDSYNHRLQLFQYLSQLSK